MSAIDLRDAFKAGVIPDLDTELRRPLMRSAFLYYLSGLSFVAGAIATLVLVTGSYSERRERTAAHHIFQEDVNVRN